MNFDLLSHKAGNSQLSSISSAGIFDVRGLNMTEISSIVCTLAMKNTRNFRKPTNISAELMLDYFPQYWIHVSKEYDSQQVCF